MYKRLEKKILITCVTLLLRPVANFCLRHGMRIQDFTECSKNVFVEAAEKYIKKLEGDVTDSRVSVMTGVHRRDVKRLREQQLKFDGQAALTTRVVGQWQTDKLFVTKANKPRILTYGTEDSEFHALVRTVSKDVNPATVLFELERVNAVEKTPKGIKLVIESYVPSGDVEGGFKILSNDSDDFIAAVEENVMETNEIPNLHVRTEYDSVRPEHVPEIRRWFIREGHMLHQRARNFISQFDQDINPSDSFGGEKTRIVLGTFSRVEED